jgi:nicotinamide mononucleotide (NMN) deamidase PncC
VDVLEAAMLRLPLSKVADIILQEAVATESLGISKTFSALLLLWTDTAKAPLGLHAVHRIPRLLQNHSIVDERAASLLADMAAAVIMASSGLGQTGSGHAETSAATQAALALYIDLKTRSRNSSGAAVTAFRNGLDRQHALSSAYPFFLHLNEVAA